MKKALLVLAVVAVVVVGSVLWVLRSMGLTDPALMVSSQTVVFAALPDLPRTAIRWPQTALAKILGEPEVKAFLEKPFAKLGEDPSGKEATDLLLGLKPGRIFVAAHGAEGAGPGVLVGFQFWGGRGDFDRAMARLREEVSRTQASSGEPTPETHEGDTILISEHGPTRIVTAAHGRWGFVGNSVEVVREALDRAAGRLTAGALAADPLFIEAAGKLPSDPDVVFFCRPGPILDALLAVGASMGAEADPAQIEQVRKAEAVAAAVKLDGANLRDAVFVVRRNPPDVGNLSHATIQLASPGTSAFFDFVVNFRQAASLTANPALSSALARANMKGSHLVDLAPDAFGPECGVIIGWPAGQMKPEAVLAVQIRDAAAAEAFLRELTAQFPETTITENDGAKTYHFPTLQSPFANPSVTVAEGFLLVGLDRAEVEKAIATARSGQNLSGSPDFAKAAPAFQSANEVFGFIDSQVLFTRGYTTFRPILTFGVALVPGATDWIDSSKLPSTEAITKHLAPMLFSQTRTPDGYLVESSGPISTNQAALVGAILAVTLSKPAER